MAILFNGAEPFEQFWLRVSQGTFPVKLFQNLYTGLAEVVKSSFLFIALATILFNEAESFEQFWYRVYQETFLYNHFKIHLLVQEKKSLKGFFLFLPLAAILFNGAERFEQL